MTHDSLCPMGQSLTTLTPVLCLCTLISGVRDDERSKNDREGMWVDGYESALNDAREAVERVAHEGHGWLDALAAIDALREKP